MSQNLITLIGVVDSLSFVIRDFKNELHSRDEVLCKLGTLKKELLDAKLREASLTVNAERMLEAALAGVYPAFARQPEIQGFITNLQKTIAAEVTPPPLPSCSSSKKSVS
jgi:hypothetical protein